MWVMEFVHHVGDGSHAPCELMGGIVEEISEEATIVKELGKVGSRGQTKVVKTSRWVTMLDGGGQDAVLKVGCHARGGRDAKMGHHVRWRRLGCHVRGSRNPEMGHHA